MEPYVNIFCFLLLQAKKVPWSFSAPQLIDSSSLTLNNSTVGLVSSLFTPINLTLFQMIKHD